MKRTLQGIAGLLALGAVVVWLVFGANRGWTKTRVQLKTVDAVTGIEQVTWQEKFLPGVDFLGAGLLGAGALAGASLIFRNRNDQTQTNRQNQT